MPDAVLGVAWPSLREAFGLGLAAIAPVLAAVAVVLWALHERLEAVAER